MSKRQNLEKRARAVLARNAAKRAELAKVDTRAARASVANGAAVLAPVPVAVGLLCPKCGGLLVSLTVNGRDVGAPFCRTCEAP